MLEVTRTSTTAWIQLPPWPASLLSNTCWPVTLQPTISWGLMSVVLCRVNLSIQGPLVQANAPAEEYSLMTAGALPDLSIAVMPVSKPVRVI